jgi:hypothetical protein
VRRSPRLYWTMEEARLELSRWIVQLRLTEVSWDIVTNDVIICRTARYLGIVSGVHLPCGPDCIRNCECANSTCADHDCSLALT